MPMLIKIAICFFSIYGIIAIVKSILMNLTRVKRQQVYHNKLILSIEDTRTNIEGLLRTLDRKYLQSELMTDGEIYVINKTSNKDIDLIIEKLNQYDRSGYKGCIVLYQDKQGWNNGNCRGFS